MPNKITIIIGGDTVPTKSNEENLINGQPHMVFNQVMDTFLSADIVVVNLESPLTNSEKYINKTGPCLKARPETINGLIDAGIDIFSLANNHIMDFGPEGLDETTRTIVGKHARITGAGENLSAARKFLIIQHNGYKIAFISVAEHEFSIAEEYLPGANPFDPFDTIDDIKRARIEVDLVIVLYHGGIEHYRLPSPNLQRVCRKLVESGADYVVCQHSHCIGAYEKYHKGHIIYGQGNLLFDHEEDEMWQTGLILRIVAVDSSHNIEFIPIVKKGNAIDLAKGTEKERIIEDFNKRNQVITDQRTIQKEWQAFANKRKYYYLQTFLGFNKLLTRIDNRLGNFLSRALYNQTTYTHLYNYINCEAHMEIINSILLKESRNKE